MKHQVGILYFTALLKNTFFFQLNIVLTILRLQKKKNIEMYSIYYPKMAYFCERI